MIGYASTKQLAALLHAPPHRPHLYVLSRTMGNHGMGGNVQIQVRILACRYMGCHTLANVQHNPSWPLN